MVLEANNPGVIILLILGSMLLFSGLIGGFEELDHGNASFLMGVVGGVAAAGIAFAALRGTPETRPMLWVAFAMSLPVIGFLAMQATGSDNVVGGQFLGLAAGWLAMPFAIAVAQKADRDREATAQATN